MAKATVDTVTKTVEKEVREKVYVLTLSEAEAKAFFALTGGVDGNRVTTHNKHIWAARTALENAGIKNVWFSDHFTHGVYNVIAKAL